MKRVAYAGGSFLTGDKIADLVLDYAAVLARSGQADHVRIPALGADDNLTTFDLVLGPASQIVAEPVAGSLPEIEDEELISTLEQRARWARAGRLDDLGHAGPQ